MYQNQGPFMWEYLSSFTVSQLKRRLSEVGLNRTGNKSELIQRLIGHLKSKKVSNDVSKMRDLMTDYISNPEQYGDKKLVDKLFRRISKKLDSKQMSEKEFIHYLFKLAEKRIESQATNVFLMNIGSSGSHWIEAMLDEFPEVVCINEVYFPKALRKKVINFDRHALNLMMNVITLAHMKVDEELHFDKIVVNSAHVIGTEFYRKCDDSCICMMLTRDPYDIVISRTFRKNSYREYIAPDATDMEYLDLNLFRVNRFFNKNPKSNFLAVVKYEDFIDDGENALKEILKLIGVKLIDDDLIAKVRYKHDRNTILSGESKNAANLYTGERKKLPKEMNEKIILNLESVRRELNYI